MVGAIRTWDILFHPVVTIRCFGWMVFWRALFAGHGRTFLSVSCQDKLSESALGAMPFPLRQCIQIELQGKRIYQVLARAFVVDRSAARFFTDLAEQEQDHADLLSLCWTAARHGGWKAEHFDTWKIHLPSLESRMKAIESNIDTIDNLDKAFDLVLEIESSEINREFRAAVDASEAAFVKRLKPFQDAIETHISYIVTQVSRQAPHVMSTSRKQWAGFPQMR
jgi:hypothetical protein